MNSRKIAFGYSTRCNLKCGHCVAVDEVPSSATMELTQARAVVRAMALANVGWISFTAGEPLLLLNDMLGLIRLCRKNEIRTRVVTNGFWAKTRQQANEIVDELQRAGLSQLRISCSRWHQAQINPDHIVNAAAGCKALGLDYYVSFITDFSKADRALEKFLHEQELKYFPEPVIYFGRAEGMARQPLLTDYQPNICAMNPYLSPELDMFACCDGADRFRKTHFLFLGNLKDYTIEQLFQRYENNRLYGLIQTVGLTPLASSVGLASREIVTLRKCELCAKLFNSTHYLKQLKAMASADATRWCRYNFKG